MKKFLAILALILVGCAKDPTGKTEMVGEFQVENLFTVDGITVYRFSDCGSYIYFASSTSTSWRKSQGKTTKPVLVVTDDNGKAYHLVPMEKENQP